MEDREDCASTGNAVNDVLCIDNGLEVPQEMKEKFLQALQHQLHMVTKESLDMLRSEISAYDPFDKGNVDSSSLKRVFMKYYKLIPIEDLELELLLKIFAVNVRKCHLVKYLNLLVYLDHLISNKSTRCASHPFADKLVLNELRPNASTSQSPCYRRGDAKLINDLQINMINNGIKFIDADQIRRDLAFADRGHKESLSRQRIEQIFRDHKLLDAIAPIFDHLLIRCSLIDNQYNWSELANFLEKANPDLDHRQKNIDQNTVNGNGNAPKPLVRVCRKTHENMEQHPTLSISSFIEDRPPKNEVQVNGRKSRGMTNSPSFNKLAEQLNNLDSGNTGHVSAFQAQNVIQKYNNLYQLGLDSKKLGRILAEASEKDGQQMNLAILTSRLAYQK